MPRSTYWGGGTVIAAGVWWFFLEFVKELLFGALGTWVTSRMSDDGAQLLFDYVVPYGPPILLLSLGIMALSGVGQNIHITASPPFFREVQGKDAYVESPELNKTAWQQEWHELRFRRKYFWLLINRAYEHWGGKLEEPLQRIIPGSGFPKDLPLLDNTTFSAWVWEFPNTIDDVSAAANDYASVLDQFASYIYGPGKSELKSLAFGGVNEFDRFDDLRGELSKFWDHWGRQEPIDRVVSEQMTSGILRSSMAELKLLTFLEIARARWNPTGASGKDGLFKLGEKACHPVNT